MKTKKTQSSRNRNRASGLRRRANKERRMAATARRHGCSFDAAQHMARAANYDHAAEEAELDYLAGQAGEAGFADADLHSIVDGVCTVHTGGQL